MYAVRNLLNSVSGKPCYALQLYTYIYHSQIFRGFEQEISFTTYLHDICGVRFFGCFCELCLSTQENPKKWDTTACEH